MISVPVTVSGSLLLGADIPLALKSALQKELRLPNPLYVKAKALGFYAGKISPHWNAWELLETGELRLPRGAGDILKRLCAAYGCSPVFADKRTLGRAIACDAPPLRDYQAEGVSVFVKQRQGLIVLPCGAGKSRLGLGAIAAIGRSALILVNTGDLLEQWYFSLREWFPHLKIGEYSGQKKDDLSSCDVMVATIQSLGKAIKIDPGCVDSYGVLLVDETHIVCADTMRKTVAQIPAHYRLGLSATPDREDGLGPAVRWICGPVLLQKTAMELVRAGVLSQPKIEKIHTDFEFEFEGQDDDPTRTAELQRQIAHDPARNEKIVDLVAAQVLLKQTILVLSNRKDHCQLLYEALAKKGILAAVLTSGTPKKERTLLLDQLRNGSQLVAIATSLADQGLDIVRLSRVVLAFPERAQGRTIQRVGRLMRVFAGKEPILYDFVDTNVPTLVRRAKARHKSYVSLGFL